MQLKFIEQKSSNKYIEHAGTVSTALLMGAASMIWILSAFDLDAGSAGNITGGMVRLWNGICDCLGKSDYILLTKHSGAADGSGIFIVLAGLLLAASVYVMLRSRISWLLLLYVIPFFTVQMLWDVEPAVWTSVFFLISVMTAVMYCVYSQRGSIWPSLLIVCIAIVILITAVLCTGGSYSHHNGLAKIQSAIEEKEETLRYGCNIRGDGNLEPSDFDNSETVLKVTMDEPDSIYLKGFTGSLYESGRWDHLTCETYYAENDMFYWLHKNGFSGMNQIRTVTELMGKNEETHKITVSNTGASRKYIYYPYELADQTKLPGKNWSDSFVSSGGLTGEKEYSYMAVSSKTELWPSLSAEFFNTEDSSKLQQYIINESNYNVQVYEDYTQLTEAQEDMLGKYIGSRGNQEKEHIDYKKAASRVKTILEDNFIYSETTLSGKDPLHTFFMKKKGCDIHYATASTLMFRYYGIPARYVEGYIITPEDVKNAESGDTIDIPASNNHAWTEIYIDGFGWVPFEATPEYYERMEQPDMSKGLESNMVSDPFRKNRNVQQRQQVQTDPDADETNHDFPWKIILCIMLVILIIAVLTILTIRKMRKVMAKRKRIKAFHDPDIRAGICAIYQYMLNQQFTVNEMIREIGERAAFSPHEVTTDERALMLEELEKKERETREKKNHSSNHDSNTCAEHGRMRKFRK